MGRRLIAVLSPMLNAVQCLGRLVQVPAAPTPSPDSTPVQTTDPSVATFEPSVTQSAYPSPAYAPPLASTNSTETISNLLIQLGEELPDDLSWTTGTDNSTLLAANWTSSLSERDLVSPVDKFSAQRNVWFSFNSSGHGGYNISIPGCLATDLVLGDMEAPNGTIISNATLADVITTLNLPGKALWNYTLTMATQLSNQINATLDNVVCGGAAGATRQLLWPGWPRPPYRDPNSSEGFTSAMIVGLIGTTGIAWGGTRLAIAKKWPTQNITINTEVAILAATTALQFTFITILWRLQSVPKRWVGRIEAAVLNFFILIGEKLLKGLQYIDSNTCFSTEETQDGLSNWLQRAQNQAQIFRFGYRGGNTASAQNLIEVATGPGLSVGSLANVPPDQIPQVMRQVAIMDIVNQQIEGAAPPGTVCGNGAPNR